MIRRKINIRPADVARTTALTVPRTTSKKARKTTYMQVKWTAAVYSVLVLLEVDY